MDAEKGTGYDKDDSSNDITGTHCIVSKPILLNSFTHMALNRTILYTRHRNKPWSIEWPKAGEDTVNI